MAVDPCDDNKGYWTGMSFSSSGLSNGSAENYNNKNNIKNNNNNKDG